MKTRSSHRTAALTALTVAVLLGLLIACMAVFPALLVQAHVQAHVDAAANGTLSTSDRLKAENDARLALLQGFAGVIAVAGVATGVAATLRQVRASRESSMIGLFTKAIDQLSSDNLSVRHGGVYALELLSGIDQQYRGHVHALLTAFIRQRVPWPPTQTVAPADERGRLHGGLPDDVGAALGALSRRKMIENGAISELEKLDLRGADLQDTNFHGSCLLGSNLEGANLSGANLTNTALTDTVLRNSDLSGADLTGATLSSKTDLTGIITNSRTIWPAGWRL